MYDNLKVPSLEKLKFKNLTQYFSYNDDQLGKGFEPIEKGFNNFADLKYLQMQVDHLEGTNFVQVNLF
jgi:hypothetical protein